MTLWYARFQSLQHLTVLRTLILSPQLPRPVLSLCGPSVVRLLSEGRGVSQPFDVTALRIEVTKTMGITVAGLASPSTLHGLSLTPICRADAEHALG
jgi:hypothetical protein